MTRTRLVIRALAVVVGCAVGIAAAVAAGAAPGADRAAARPDAFRGALMPPHVLAPPLALRDEDGDAIGLPRGKVAVVTFATAVCRETCPLTMQLIRGALDDLGYDVPAIAVAVDPRADTPAAARRFVALQRVQGRIRFALGTRAQLAPVWRGFGVQPQTATEEHQARIVLVDRRGVQRVGYFAQDATSEDLAHDLRILGTER